jgi:hypothetical protein
MNAVGCSTLSGERGAGAPFAGAPAQRWKGAYRARESACFSCDDLSSREASTRRGPHRAGIDFRNAGESGKRRRAINRWGCERARRTTQPTAHGDNPCCPTSAVANRFGRRLCQPSNRQALPGNAKSALPKSPLVPKHPSKGNRTQKKSEQRKKSVGRRVRAPAARSKAATISSAPAGNRGRNKKRSASPGQKNKTRLAR